jgi:hypothetical protein
MFNASVRLLLRPPFQNSKCLTMVGVFLLFRGRRSPIAPSIIPVVNLEGSAELRDA